MWESPRNWPSLSLKWRDNVAILYARFTRRAALRFPMRLRDLTAYLDDYLRVRDVPDAPRPLKGRRLPTAGKTPRWAAPAELSKGTGGLPTEWRATLFPFN